jgi:hypothetical protein
LQKYRTENKLTAVNVALPTTATIKTKKDALNMPPLVQTVSKTYTTNFPLAIYLERIRIIPFTCVEVSISRCYNATEVFFFF